MQQDSTEMNGTIIGIDLGDKRSHVCVMDTKTREVVEEGTISTTKTGFERRFVHLPRTRIVIEASTHSPWVSLQLKELGHEVIVANPRKVRLITENDNKCDRLDAEQLTRLAAADVKLLYPIEHRGAQTRSDRSVLVTRRQIVKVRTALVNCARGVVKSHGGRLKGGTASLHRKVRDQIPEELQPALSPVLDLLEEVEVTIKTLDKQVTELTKKYPETGALMQVNGVGPITALDYVLTLEDPARFKKSRSVGAYVGLRPRSKSSGRSQPELSITKAGDGMLRSHLVQCAQYTLGAFGKDSDLRRWGLKLAARGGKNAKKRAIVAVARRLAVLLHQLWRNGEVYEPLRHARASEVA